MAGSSSSPKAPPSPLGALERGPGIAAMPVKSPPTLKSPTKRNSQSSMASTFSVAGQPPPSAGSQTPASAAAVGRRMSRRSSFSAGPDYEQLGKEWARLVGPDGEESRVKVDRAVTTTELRKAISARVRLAVKMLELKVNGKLLYEGNAQPLIDLSEDQWVVYWDTADRLKSLLHAHALDDINSIGKFERTALHFAVLDGDPEVCKDIIFNKELKEGMINRRDIFMDSPLMLAAILGYLEIVEILVDRHANLDFMNLCGRTALQMAAEHGHDKIAKILMAEKASLEESPPVRGPMGMTHRSKSAPYLARLNERYMVTHRIKLHKLSHKKQPGLDF